MTLQELLQSRMHKGAALGGAGIGIERVERPQMQNLASVKGIGIAHPGLDARDRELARSGGSRRAGQRRPDRHRSEEHTSELQSLMRISYTGLCLKKKKK